jgi:hypothetical protein
MNFVELDMTWSIFTTKNAFTLQCNANQLKELCNNSVSSSVLIPHLDNLVQQTMFQQVWKTLLMSSFISVLYELNYLMKID